MKTCYILMYYAFLDKRGNPEIICVFDDKEIAEERCKYCNDNSNHKGFYVKQFPIYPIL